MRAGDVDVRGILEELSDPALVACGREMAKDMRSPTDGCRGESEAADLIEVLCHRLETSSVSRTSD